MLTPPPVPVPVPSLHDPSHSPPSLSLLILLCSPTPPPYPIEICNDALTDVRNVLTSTMMDKENVESNYEALLSTHKDYKAKTDEELTNLRKLPSKVSELEKKLNKTELDLEGYRLKEAPADQEAVAKVKNEMRRLTQKTQIHIPPPTYPSTATEPSSLESNKRRSDGRRVGVIVKDGREGKSSSPAKIDPVTGTIGMRTPTSAKPRKQSSVKPFSPKGLADDEGSPVGGGEGEEEEQQQQEEGQKQQGQRQQQGQEQRKGKEVADEVIEERERGRDQEEEDLELKEEENAKMKRKTSVPRRASIRYVQPSRRSSVSTAAATAASVTPKETKGQSKASSSAATTTSAQSSQNRKGSVGSLKKQPTKSKISTDPSEGSNGSLPASATATDGSDIPASGAASARSAVSARAGDAPEEQMGDERESDDDEDDFKELAAPPKVLLKTSSMSQRRMTRLASLEDPILPTTENLLGKAVDTLVEDEESAKEVGIDEEMKNGLLRSLSRVSSYSSRQGSGVRSDDGWSGRTEEGLHEEESEGEGEEEEEEEVDEIEEEMSNDVAKTWGQLTKALNNALSENLGDEIANKASHVIAPVTIEFCSILSKCTMVRDSSPPPSFLILLLTFPLLLLLCCGGRACGK
jgi:hypothetical protein